MLVMRPKRQKDMNPVTSESIRANPANVCVLELSLPSTIPIGSDGFKNLMTNQTDIPPQYISKVHRIGALHNILRVRARELCQE